MKEIIQADYPIVREEIPTDEAVLIFRKRGLKDKANLMETRGKTFHFPLLSERSSRLFLWDPGSFDQLSENIRSDPYKEGMLLQLPDRTDPTRVLPVIPQDKLYQVFSEYKRWGKILEVTDIGHLNKNRGVEIFRSYDQNQ